MAVQQQATTEVSMDTTDSEVTEEEAARIKEALATELSKFLAS